MAGIAPEPEHTTATTSVADDDRLHRTLDWKGAFWIASGVPALVLFSIGTIAATIGAPSVLVWGVSIAFGLVQSFIWAEIAGLFPRKSGGASVYGAMAWVRYSKLVAPLSVWCNWLAWSPVLMIGSSLAAGYVLTALFPADAVVNTWSMTLLPLEFLSEGLELRINATFVVAALFLLLVFALQHGGILRAARVQTIIGLAVLVPLLIIGLVPLLTGDVLASNFAPFVPLSGAWDLSGWTLLAGGLFLAAWSAYAFETSICYTAEFRDPGRDTVRAIMAAGLACLVIYLLVPIAFQGALGPERLAEPGIVDGDGVGQAMTEIVGGGPVIANLLIVMLVLALLLTIMTTMAGSSRTLYQGSRDGWLPRFLGHANRHGAPTRAMWTDLVFNLLLLLLSDAVFVLAASTVCYMIFNFLNLNAGWMHRLDNPSTPRPFRAPTALLALGTVLAFVNALLLGWGASVWGAGALVFGLVGAAIILPVFAYRHFVQDRGVFPDTMYEDLPASERGPTGVLVRRAGIRPFLALAGGVAMVVVGQVLAAVAG
ncbi:APC family permease [Pseudonocardia sp. C8]|uniref:APC family permease n=1 Tax=Pseudonocardia sp. C8 TaxID=2762759 RepID=UPI001642AE1E|nr:APC family permease [Pseudonocardia sp. C8]MBC3190394.1 APC family permease [Pseudonocardia sp. C8]